MKKTIYTALFAVFAAGLSSCDSAIDNFMVDDTVSLVNPGLVEEKVYTGLEDPSTVYALKSGKGFQSAKVSIVVDKTVLDQYNETAEQQLSELPADCYTITVSSLDLSKGDYMRPFLISWDRARLAQVLSENPNYAIPLRMHVETTDVNVNEERITTLIKPVLETPYLSLASYGLTMGLTPTRRSSIEQDIYMDIKSNFIAQEDIDIKLEVDPSLVEEYNKANGTSYRMLPEDAFRIKTDWTLKKYMNSCRFKFTFVRSAIIPEDGPSRFGTYILPIRLKSLSSSGIDPEKDYVLYTISVVAAKIDKSKWSIVECNSNIADDPDKTTAAGDYGPDYLIDGSTSKYWRSVWSVNQELPYYAVIDFGQERALYKLGFDAPTGANRRYSNSKAGYVEASLDGQSWSKIADWVNPSKSSASVEFEVTPTTARYIKFTITEVFGKVATAKNENATAIAEINAWGE